MGLLNDLIHGKNSKLFHENFHLFSKLSVLGIYDSINNIYSNMMANILKVTWLNKDAASGASFRVKNDLALWIFCSLTF